MKEQKQKKEATAVRNSKNGKPQEKSSVFHMQNRWFLRMGIGQKMFR